MYVTKLKIHKSVRALDFIEEKKQFLFEIDHTKLPHSHSLSRALHTLNTVVVSLIFVILSNILDERIEQVRHLCNGAYQNRLAFKMVLNINEPLKRFSLLQFGFFFALSLSLTVSLLLSFLSKYVYELAENTA